MRALVPVCSSLLLVAGCQDYTIGGTIRSSGSGEPPPLHTPHKTDRIVQSNPLGVDVLWVVDNSCSMQDKQDLLAANFPSFIDMFIDSDLDWHIGVVSTDNVAAKGKGQLHPARDGTRYLEPTITDADALFSEMVRLGTGGATEEKGLATANNAIAQPTSVQQQANDGFYRDDAALHVIVVSDEQDSSAITVGEFTSWMTGLKRSIDIPVTFSSIVEFRNGGCGPSDGGTRGGKYLDSTAIIGGIASDICDPDWSPVLTEIGEKASGRKREFFLSEVPVPGTIEVTVQGRRKVRHGVDLDAVPPRRTVDQVCAKKFDDAALCFPFTYDPVRNSVHLPEWMPNPLDEIDVDYDLLAGLQQSSDVADSDVAETDAP